MKKLSLLILFLIPQLAFSFINDLTDFEGKNIALDPKTEKVLVFFWGTWCPECKDKMKGDLLSINKDQKTQVLTVNMDRNDRRAKHFIKKEDLKLPVYRDEKKILRKSLKVFAAPHWAVYKKSKVNWELVTAEPSFDLTKVKKALEL